MTSNPPELKRVKLLLNKQPYITLRVCQVWTCPGRQAPALPALDCRNSIILDCRKAVEPNCDTERSNAAALIPSRQ